MSIVKMQTTASSDVVVGCTNIYFHILPTSLFMFPMLLRRRICFPIRSFLSGDCFLYSYPLTIIVRGYNYCTFDVRKEKDASYF